MTKPLPISRDLIDAAERALAATEDCERKRTETAKTVRSDGYRRWEDAARAYCRQHEDLAGKAQALFDWALGVRRLPAMQRLHERFGLSAPMPRVTLLRVEVRLYPYALSLADSGFGGGLLEARFDLEPDEDLGPMRYDQWFDTFRQTGGGVLNTPSSVELQAHPQAVLEGYRLVAEGFAETHLRRNLDQLVRAYKDR